MTTCSFCTVVLGPLALSWVLVSGDTYSVVVKHAQHGYMYSFCIVVLSPLALSWVLVSGDAYNVVFEHTQHGYMY